MIAFSCTNFFLKLVALFFVNAMIDLSAQEDLFQMHIGSVVYAGFQCLFMIRFILCMSSQNCVLKISFSVVSSFVEFVGVGELNYNVF